MMLNDYYQNIGMKEFFERYGIVNAVRRGLFIATPIHFVHDYEVKKVLWQHKASKKIKFYLKYKNTEPTGLQYSDIQVDQPIWIYWNSGIENAPTIIKKCYESVVRYGGRTVILLSESNIEEYLKFPEYITRKKEKKLIPLAGYTDLMRFALLAHYGGTWFDATIYLTNKIPEAIFNSDFFAFRNSMGLLTNPVLYPAWFTHSKNNNETINTIRNIAFAYWTNENHVNEYLLPNLIMTKVIQDDIDIENQILYLNSDYSEYFVRVLGDEYSEEKYNWIKSLTCIHKLTYKLDSSIDRPGTFYRYIIEN